MVVITVIIAMAVHLRGRTRIGPERDVDKRDNARAGSLVGCYQAVVVLYGEGHCQRRHSLQEY
jgi:hypothetical protein